jgi:hypothetical protein
MMRRSIAQQVEHWAGLGAALESAGVTHDQLRKVLGGDLRSRERVMMKLGLASQESMYFVPPDVAAKATLGFPPDSTLDLA